MTLRTKVEIVAAPLLLLLGVGIGGFARPARVETKIVDHVVTKTEYQDRVVEKVIESKSKESDKQKVVYIDRTITKEGAVHEVEKVVYQDKIVEHTNVVHDRVEVASGSTEKVETHSAERTVIAQSARWSIFAGAGASIGLTPLGVSPSYIGGVNYRLLGPVGVGAWATFEQARLAPTAGVLVSITF